MDCYLDTSALCRYYHPEPGSSVVEQWLDDPNSRHLISWLTATEALSAFALKVRTREIAESEFVQLRRWLKQDLAQRRFGLVRVLRRHYDGAAELLTRFGLNRRLRTLDALHLAIALDPHERKLVQGVMTADQMLETVAAQEGLPIRNPLTP